MPEYRVASFGKGGNGSRTIPFPEYHMSPGPSTYWGERDIEKVWTDFSGGEYGAIFTIWDASRMLWFARPEYAGDDSLRGFLSAHHFERWGYFPVDSTGPQDRLTTMSREVLLGYDRVLAYTRWGRDLIERTMGSARGLDWAPHGIDFNTFQPRDNKKARAFLSPMCHEGDFVVGIVATNQARKDWGLALTVCAMLRQKVKRLRIWIHTDLQERHWSIPALLNDYGLSDIVIQKGPMSDELMSYAYSACDVTLAPGLGEGFGYPIAESLACGTPVIHGNYGGGKEITPEELRVDPVAYRLDTLHNCLRPVFRPEDWLMAVEVSMGVGQPEQYRALIEHLDWTKLWPRVWQPMFLKLVETI